ncbi:IS66 family transposase [Thalassomonas viridans]|uniref:IS66 family transposase n=1 Tax=Thalassomonas viridans TaxID=137584 RepID=A0AAE9Z9C6_9GAMM|nr:IS66 family transposase [Thalassomonas viridans]
MISTPYPMTLSCWKQMLATLQQELAQAHSKYEHLLEQFRLAQHQRFGKSSEAAPGQGELFNEAEIELDAPVDEAGKQDISHTRSKAKRKQLPQDLPREIVLHDLADDEKFCDGCQGELHKIGEDKSEKLEFIPAQVKVIEQVRPKYACRHCEQHGIEVKVKQAPVPPGPIPKGIATASLLSQIITSKYQYGLPLYRQESLFKQYGIELSRKTMADWMIKMGHLLEPLYQRLKTELLKQPVIQADETPLNVIKEEKSTCYMWLYCTGADSPVKDRAIANIVLYDYQSSRAGTCPKNYLDGYNGYLQVDGYQAYEQTDATLAGCMAHARRKFTEAKKAQPKGKTGKADMALSQIQKLYGIESQLKGKSADEKYRVRQEKAKPLIDKLYQWLAVTQPNVAEKSVLGKAVNYMLNQWPKLIRYLDDGLLSIDNNRAERAIKPFVIGRKNWLFSHTANGAQASAMLYSIIETAKANGLMPFDYLNHLLTELPKPDHNLETMLPWQSKDY